jgi:hypothetical protein
VRTDRVEISIAALGDFVSSFQAPKSRSKRFTRPSAEIAGQTTRRWQALLPDVLCTLATRHVVLA